MADKATATPAPPAAAAAAPAAPAGTPAPDPKAAAPAAPPPPPVAPVPAPTDPKAGEPAAPAPPKGAWMGEKAPEPGPDGKPGEKPKEGGEAPKPPVQYEIKLPDGKVAGKDVVARYESLARELNLTNDGLQKLYDRDQKHLADIVTSAKGEVAERNAQWHGDLEKSWGKDFKERSETALRGFNVMDPDGSMRKVLAQENLDNWPPLVEAAERVGRMFKEDKMDGQARQAMPEVNLPPLKRLELEIQKRMDSQKKG